MSDYYDRAGNPMTLDEWARLYEQRDPDPRRVAFSENDDGSIRVSTVWLGLDHNWGDGPPLIFETMVFAPPSHPNNEYQRRWSTEAEALAGHAEICSRLLR